MNVVNLSSGPPRYSCAMLCRSVLPMLTFGVMPLPCLPRLSAISCLYHFPTVSNPVLKMKVSCMFLWL